MINRRKFVTALLALPGLALAKITGRAPEGKLYRKGESFSLGPIAPPSNADQIMATIPPSGGSQFNFGPWTIRWTGWKPYQATAELVGQWLAWPVTPDGEYDNERLALYMSAPGHFGTFSLGDTFNMAYRWPQKTTADHILAAHKAGVSGHISNIYPFMEGERRIALESLLELAVSDMWIKPKPYRWDMGSEAMMAVWPKLTPRCRFYLNPDKYMALEYGPLDGWGVMDDLSDAQIALREKVGKELLGLTS